MIRKSIISAVIMLTLLWLPAVSTIASAADIDPDDSGRHYAYGENIGWISFKPDRGPGVTISDNEISGFVWSELAGWINLDPAKCNDCGVANDGKGNLIGWAWGQLVGWISLSCKNTASCDKVAYGVRIDPETGRFTGQAWGENIGWINFDTAKSVDTGVETGWRTSPGAGGDTDSPDPLTDGGGRGGSGGCFIEALQMTPRF